MIVSDGKALDFAPQALGETTPFVANGYFYATQGMGLINQFASYSHLYRVQPSIATVVDKVAAAAARLTVKVWDVTPESGRAQDKDSDYAKLIANPCTSLAPFAFWRWTFSTYEVYGEAFWYKQRADRTALGLQTGKVVNLLPMHPSRTAVHRKEDGTVEYIFTLGVASTGILYAPAADVVAFLRYNPDNLMRGLSRLESLRMTLLNEDAARRANESFWRKGARPAVVLTHPHELSQEAMDRIKSSFDARHAGADNTGSTAVLQEGMTTAVVQLNAEEMQYIESRKLNREEVCMVYDVPPPVIHILDHATFSNITEQMRSMYRDTMSPRLEDVESVIDDSLLPEFFATGQRETEFDMSEVLRGDFETRADKAVTLRQSGIFTGNQALELLGQSRSDDPEMDKLYANAALVPLGSNTLQQVSTDGELIATPVRSQRSIEAPKEVTVRAVMGKLARIKGNKSKIRETLVAEHNNALKDYFDEQRAAVKADMGIKSPTILETAQWDERLAKILSTLGTATAQAIGTQVADELGGTYSSDSILPWINENALATAQKVNKATSAEIAAAIEAADDDADEEETIDAEFDGEIAARTDQISLTRVAMVAGLASLVAARLSDAKTKTWVVTSGKPRASHAQMSGETVPLGELFSNGGNGPGDYSMGADEVAGCTCDLDFST